MSAPQAILVLGTYRYSLTIIRSLSKAGYRVIAGIQKGDFPFGKYSRFTHEVWQHASIKENENHFAEELQSFFQERPDVSLLFPIGDTQARFLANNPYVTPDHVATLTPSPEIVAICHDKLKMYAIAKQLDIPQKPVYRITSFTELKAQVNRLGYPCVIRPPNQFIRIFGEVVF